MSTVSSVQSFAVQQYHAPSNVKTDADGDRDGTTAAKMAAQAAPKPQLPKPTATLGNNVNIMA